jgi:hypothetical protein
MDVHSLDDQTAKVVDRALVFLLRKWNHGLHGFAQKKENKQSISVEIREIRG